MSIAHPFLIAAIAGVGAIAIIWMIFPLPANFLSFDADASANVKQQPTLTLSISKMNNADGVKTMPLEIIKRNPDLDSAIRHIEIEYLGELICHSRPIPSNALVFCAPATHSANITLSSAESIASDILIASGTRPIDYVFGSSSSSHNFQFAIEGRGAYSMTILVA